MKRYINRTTLLPLYALSLIMLCYKCQNIMAPFVSGALLAYISYPIVKITEAKINMSHSFAAGIIVAIITILISSLTIMLVPLIYKELLSIDFYLPSTNITQYTTGLFIKFYNNIPEYLKPHIKTALLSIPEQILSLLQYMLSTLVTSTSSIINLMLYVILSPVVAYHIIKDKTLIKETLLTLLPAKIQKLAISCAQNIDEVLYFFLRGQCVLAVIWTTYYITSFYIIGVNASVFLGILSGLSCLIPYIGTVFSSIIAFTVVITQFKGIGTEVILTISIYIIGHALDMILISNKILGKKLGLHPLLTIFSLLFSASFFGIFGIFIAIPTTVLIKRSFAFFLKHLKNNEIEQNI